MRVLVGLLGLSVAAAGQTAAPKPFAPTAELGKPYVLGEDPDDYGKIKVDYGKKFAVTLEKVEVALRFANRGETLLARANQKLLIFRGKAKNLSPDTNARLGAAQPLGVRIWRRFEGPGEFRVLMVFEAETLRPMSADVAPGATASFVEVLEVPAGYEPAGVGLFFRSARRIAWYDVRPEGRPTLARTAVAAGAGFELDTVDLRVAAVERTSSGWAVDVQVKNTMYLPVRWGWQYFTAELVGADGTAVRFYPEIIDKATGKPWVGDLNPEASMTGRYTFTTAAGFAPRLLRLTSAASARVADVELGR